MKSQLDDSHCGTTQQIISSNDDLVNSIMPQILLQVPGLVNVDFADVRAIMTGAGSSLMGQGRASGKARARDAALAAISSPLLDVGIERATGIVWNITGPADLTLFEVNPSCTACCCEQTETSVPECHKQLIWFCVSHSGSCAVAL